jgi:hypothetical protein
MVVNPEFLPHGGRQVQLKGAAIALGDFLREEFLFFETDEDLTQVTLVDMQIRYDIIGRDPLHSVKSSRG